MERIKTIKESILNKVLEQTGHLDKVNAKELGEAVDMIKDLAEAIYYCTITEAMEKTDKNNTGYNNYNQYYYTTYPDYNRNIDRNNGYMYYPGGSSTGNMSYYT